LQGRRLEPHNRLAGRGVGGVVCRMPDIKIKGGRIPSTEKRIFFERIKDVGPFG
jgi:hypothetical protein